MCTMHSISLEEGPTAHGTIPKRKAHIISIISTLWRQLRWTFRYKDLEGTECPDLQILYCSVCMLLHLRHSHRAGSRLHDRSVHQRQAYKQFTSRRGICTTLTSDCGTNLKGADSELEKLFSSSNENSKLASLLANDGTQWKFIPPGASHFGGKWEAGVKSVKYHLRRVVRNHLLTYQEMTTLLIQIEVILNSRPLYALWPMIQMISTH